METLNKFITNISVLPSNCDFQRRLGIYETFRIFMDIANEHEKRLSAGQTALMDKGLFWLTVKTRIKFNRRPFMDSVMKAETWPYKVGSFLSDRCYRLSDENGIIAEGITQWAILDIKDGNLSCISDMFADRMELSEDRLSFSDFPRINVCKNMDNVKKTYTVSSSDIDMGLHMNNTAYIRAMLGLFSVKELKEMEIKDVTVIFKKSAHEGDVLSMPVVRTDSIIDTGLYFSDGSPAVLARIATAG